MKSTMLNTLPMTKTVIPPAILLLVLAAGGPGRVAVPPLPDGRLYHGVFPGGRSGQESDITEADVRDYETLAGSPVSVVCFSSEWGKDRVFPGSTVIWIHERGAVPYIRLMLRSTVRLHSREPLFTLENILGGEFDEDLRAWARGARAAAIPILVEYGTEVNGAWFPWNASWQFHAPSGADRGESPGSGAELFRRAYRHIVGVCRSEGASNLSWVFHVNSTDAPDVPWNRMEKYYPGPAWIDWLGVSVYGSQTPEASGWPSFRPLMDNAYDRLTSLDPGKPVIVAEFGATAGHPGGDQAEWAEAALTDLVGGRWPAVAGFVWWNGAWENHGSPPTRTTMRLADNPRLALAFRRVLAPPDTFHGPAADQ